VVVAVVEVEVVVLLGDIYLSCLTNSISSTLCIVNRQRRMRCFFTSEGRRDRTLRHLNPDRRHEQLRDLFVVHLWFVNLWL
jgi:hypothetical protein